MSIDIAGIARASYQAYIDKDRAAMEALVADDFHFSSPLDNRIDRAAYFDRCWPNSRSIDDFEFIRVVANGDEVVVTYEARNIDGRRFRNTEVLTLRDGRIVEVEVYFGWNIPHKAAPGGFVDADKTGSGSS
jgi:ketosteroid isomerase-like protein